MLPALLRLQELDRDLGFVLPLPRIPPLGVGSPALLELDLGVLQVDELQQPGVRLDRSQLGLVLLLDQFIGSDPAGFFVLLATLDLFDLLLREQLGLLDLQEGLMIDPMLFGDRLLEPGKVLQPLLCQIRPLLGRSRFFLLSLESGEAVTLNRLRPSSRRPAVSRTLRNPSRIAASSWR